MLSKPVIREIMNKYLIKSLAFLLIIGALSLACFAQTPAPSPFPKPDDPLFNESQLGFPGLLKAWGYTRGSANVKIAILSTGYSFLLF